MLAWKAKKQDETVEVNPKITFYGLLWAAIDIGLCSKTPDRMNGGFSFEPLSWQEIKAWCDLMQPELSSKELQLVRAASIEYVDELMLLDSKSPSAFIRPDRRPEFIGDDVSAIVPVSDDAIRAAFGF